jgi:hypothetical protein
MAFDDAPDPDLSFVIPASNENRWSDLLKSMVSPSSCTDTAKPRA